MKVKIKVNLEDIMVDFEEMFKSEIRLEILNKIKSSPVYKDFIKKQVEYNLQQLTKPTLLLDRIDLEKLKA